MKNASGVVRLRMAGELAQRLAHQPSLQAGKLVAHFTFDFRLGHERGNRVDDNHVQCTRPRQRLENFERLLASVGLRNQQVIEVDAQRFA